MTLVTSVMQEMNAMTERAAAPHDCNVVVRTPTTQ